MGDVRLNSPRVLVLREGHEPVEFQTDNRDAVLWDRTRVKHKWPKFDEGPFIWLTFLSWAAARRTGAIETGYTFERWEAEVLEVRALEDDDDGGEYGRPTRPGPGPGS